MSTIEAAPLPTPKELLTITNQILEQPTPPPFTAILTDCLKHLSNPDILNFLFTPDPIHLTHFTSSTLPATAVTNTLTTTRVQPPTILPDPHNLTGESHHEHANFALVPVFTLSHKTLGVGVMEGVLNLGSPWLPKPFSNQNSILSNLRFLRDARDRSILIVTDAPEEDAVLLYYARNETLTRCHSFQAAFRRTDFLALAQDTPDVTNLSKLLPACMFIINEVQHRPCPLCNAPLKTPCACEFPVPPAAHPLDTSHFLATLMEDFGVYQGVASKLITDEGSTGFNRHVQLGVRVSCQGYYDVEHELVRRLAAWSVSGYMGKTRQDPRHSNLGSEIAFSAPLIGDGSGEVENDGAGLWMDDVVDLLFGQLRSEQEQESGSGSGSAIVSENNNNIVDTAVMLGAGGVDFEAVNAVLELDEQGMLTLSKSGGAGGGVDGLGASGGVVDEEVVKRMKMEERRRRNRMAAQRSNMKRKIACDALRVQIKAEREKIAKLKEKEEVLRSENLEMKKKVGEGEAG